MPYVFLTVLNTVAENLTYIYPTATSVKMYKIKLTMGEFDNNTILACIKSQNLIEKKKTNVTKLTVLNSEYKYLFNTFKFRTFNYIILLRYDQKERSINKQCYKNGGKIIPFVKLRVHLH